MLPYLEKPLVGESCIRTPKKPRTPLTANRYHILAPFSEDYNYVDIRNFQSWVLSSAIYQQLGRV